MVIRNVVYRYPGVAIARADADCNVMCGHCVAVIAVVVCAAARDHCVFVAVLGRVVIWRDDHCGQAILVAAVDPVVVGAVVVAHATTVVPDGDATGVRHANKHSRPCTHTPHTPHTPLTRRSLGAPRWHRNQPELPPTLVSPP